ncbi:hypothetical protein K503DRAFT_783046 [Rhizopogon vinicolor AM-OR11-026]|uniref:Uncharacterized protein n=1 Tax=Rhizopogon vinicolor AM-OR11-026 TaxID=1314800 RepID=A0A1B7N052_9AGAM|nr:hypothetical protein K503DRAFT_783046 [Rhizopogon vinicolor AM-OR11-026]
MAIWNWIEMCPQEFNEAVRSRGKLESAPERVFDLLHSAIEPSRERALWPTLTILSCLAAARLSPYYQIDVETRSVTFATPKPSHRKLNLLKSFGQKPFWDSFEEIDVAAYAEALATIFHFLSEEESIPTSICAIKAATTLSSEAPRLPWQQPLENLQTAIAPRLRDIFQMLCNVRSVDERVSADIVDLHLKEVAADYARP